MSAALRLVDVTFTHPGAPSPTLDAVGLEVMPEELVAVLGPSGSGKTTLLRVAAGLERPGSGAVVLDGVDVRGVPPERRDVTMMFQKPHLFPHLDVRDNVAFAERLRGVARHEARTAAQGYLDLVHLGGLGRRRPRELSGGQEQRVALARALAARRRVMLLDEPFSSLDTGLRRSMQDLLGEVRAALSPTVVMVTHDLDEAGLADRVAVLVAGRVEQFGPVAELWSRPSSVAVARLVGGFNELPGEIVDGQHLGALGAVRLVRGCRAAGPSVALVRMEHLDLADADTGDGVPGRVAEVRQGGPRQQVTVELTARMSPATRLRVELDLDRTVAPGDRVRVRYAGRHGLWAVSAPGPAPTFTTRDAVGPR